MPLSFFTLDPRPWPWLRRFPHPQRPQLERVHPGRQGRDSRRARRRWRRRDGWAERSRWVGARGELPAPPALPAPPSSGPPRFRRARRPRRVRLRPQLRLRPRNPARPRNLRQRRTPRPRRHRPAAPVPAAVREASAPVSWRSTPWPSPTAAPAATTWCCSSAGRSTSTRSIRCPGRRCSRGRPNWPRTSSSV